MKKLRNSNFELLRIISMLFIILYHIIVHGHVIENCGNNGIKLIVLFIEYLTLVHVNSFVLVSGYFQSESKFKSSKVWQLINSSWFYRIVIIVFLSSFGYLSLSKIQFFKETFILDFYNYWFIKCYIILYCLSPFINKLINNLERGEYFRLILVLSVIFSIIPFITGGKAFENSGFTLYNFVYLYIIGGYLRKYSLKDCYLFRRCSKQLLQLILLFIFFASLAINICLLITANEIKSYNSFFYEFAQNIITMSSLYSNPLVIIQSIAFFCLFETFNIKSNIINKISSLTFGIYLIHDNNFIRCSIYKLLKIDNGIIYSYKFIIYIFIVMLFIFIICAIIEFFRQLLFTFISNRKIFKNLRLVCSNFMKNFHLIN